MAGEVVLVLGNGEWRGKEELFELVRAADRVVAVNGGSVKARKLGIAVDQVVGDLDSLSEEALPKAMPTLRYPRAKEATDLELALDYIASLTPSQVHLFGVLGRRLDHSLANINLLEKYSFPVTIHHGGERLYLVSDGLTLPEARVGDLVSLIPLSSQVTGIRTQGLRYALFGETLYRPQSRGVSNAVVSLPCGVEVGEGRLLVVHRRGGRIRAPKGGSND